MGNATHFGSETSVFKFWGFVFWGKFVWLNLILWNSVPISLHPNLHPQLEGPDSLDQKRHDGRQSERGRRGVVTKSRAGGESDFRHIIVP
jgi:hypothetical protein